MWLDKKCTFVKILILIPKNLKYEWLSSQSLLSYKSYKICDKNKHIKQAWTQTHEIWYNLCKRFPVLNSNYCFKKVSVFSTCFSVDEFKIYHLSSSSMLWKLMVLFSIVALFNFNVFLYKIIKIK